MELNPKANRRRALWEPFVGLAALVTLPMLFFEDSIEPGAALIANSLIWLVFTGEFVAVLMSCEGREERMYWLRESILDLFIIIGSFPILPGTLQSLRLLRIGRASRLARLLRLSRIFVLGWLLKFLAKRFRINPIAFSGTTTIIAVLVGANALHILEPELVPNLRVAIWWAVTTVTTVGYGDLAPATEPGRIVAATLMIIGIACMAAFSGALASYLVKAQEEKVVREAESHILEELKYLRSKLDALEGLLEERSFRDPAP